MPNLGFVLIVAAVLVAWSVAAWVIAPRVGRHLKRQRRAYTEIPPSPLFDHFETRREAEARTMAHVRRVQAERAQSLGTKNAPATQQRPGA